MLPSLQKQLETSFSRALKKKYPDVDLPDPELQISADPVFGEFSCNAALRSAKILKKPPMAAAGEFAEILTEVVSGGDFRGLVARVEPKAPGFINLFLTPAALYGILEEILEKREDYGRSDLGKDARVQVEFVSANPTGPLSVAHARQAVVGDALVNILNFLGFSAVKEFYVNDEGNQINLLGESVRIRAEEILNGKSAEDTLGDGHYRGDYVTGIARKYLDDKGVREGDALESHEAEMKRYAVDYLMGVIKKDLSDFGVRFDVWSYQSEVAAERDIPAVIKYLEDNGHVYSADGALWFKSSALGDDKDRVIKKSDGSYTYLTPDIVYHKNKYDRGFSLLFNIWGPDHHGYIPRIKAAVRALGHDPDSLKVLIVQLATIYRDGKAVSMSTRKGQYISLREVIDEVGVDAARFFFLMRHINAHLDFDLELAKKETPENPVYYIQYAHARVHSIKRKAAESGLVPDVKGFSFLREREELELIKKLGQFPDALFYCCQQNDPCALVSYLQESAMAFHKFYDLHKVIDPQLTAGQNAGGRIKQLSAERLALIEAVKTVLSNGLSLLGIRTPERM